MMIAKEKSELTDLVCATIKTTYNTRKPGGVERCIDALNQLKSLSLSIKDIQLFESVFKLENLKRHRHPKIRKEAQDMFDSLSKNLYAQGKDNTFESGLTKLRLKPVVTRRSTDQRSLTRGAQEIQKKKKGFLELKKSYERSQTREARKTTKVTKTGFLELMKRKEDIYINKETKTDQKLLKFKRRGDVCKTITTKKLKESEIIPKYEALEKKETELVEIFEAAKKAADVANAKGLLLGKPEASRCVDALTLLMRINISPKPKEPRRLMERLEGLTRHKDSKICHAASALLHLWRQRIKRTRTQRVETKNKRIFT